jgi:cell division septal protein FtsQ
MSIFESILAAVFCMLVVFVVLTCLLVLIKLQTFLIRKFEVLGKRTE